MKEEHSEEHSEADFLGRLNQRLTRSWLGQYFEVEQRNSTFFQELRAGVVCFLTVCYIIPVNSSILSDTGGSCDPATDCTPAGYALYGDACRLQGDPGWTECVGEFKKSILAATCVAACLGTLIMSVFARMPMAVAPAMGVNAYFTYNVIGYMSTKRVTYKQALAAVFVEGWIFLFLAVTGVRGRLVELIPKNVMYATAAGIGCFLAFLGLQASEGIGFITFDASTLVTLGGCPPEEQSIMYTVGRNAITYDAVCATTVVNGTTEWTGVNVLGSPSSNYSCTGKQMRSATTWLGICTGVIMVVLMMKGVRASILVGILFCTFISWIPNTKVSYLGADSPISGGAERKTYWKKGATVPSLSMSAGQLDFSALDTGDVWVALITFLYLDFMDATSTMFALARLVGEKVPGFVNEKGQWPRQLQTMATDGASIVIGSLLGTSPLTVFTESAVGIREGGRTGITSFIVAVGFGISVFLSPIFASIPPYATGPALILVGSLMMEHSRYVQWQDLRQAVPAFLCVILMPLTYSIAYGVISGLAIVIMLWLLDAAWETVKVLSGGYKGTKTLRHVWLDTMSHFYVSFNKENVLVDELPGWEATESWKADHSQELPVVKEADVQVDRSSSSV